MSSFPYLSLLLATSLVGMVLTLSVSASLSRWTALLTIGVNLAISLIILCFGFDYSQAGFQLIERHAWISSLNIEYHVGIDGISLLFLPLTILLFGLVMLASWRSSRNLTNLYFALLLFLQTAMLGIFISLDGILFFLFWELSLIPFYFLISLWGAGAERRYAAVKYTLFMLTGGFPLLIGFVLLALNQPDQISFSYLDWLQTAQQHPISHMVFFLLFLGFAVKIPVFPLHTWLPVVAQESPMAVVALITGLKVGAYGLLRFVIPLTPEAVQTFQWLLIGLGMLGMLYGAFAALSQTNLRRMLAFSSISHVALVIVGIATLSLQGIQGAIFQLINFILISSALFLITGFLHQRIGSTDSVSLGGVNQSMPRLGAFFLIFGLASLGMPLTSGFPAEFLLIVSALQTHIGAGLVALLLVIISAAYFLSLYRRAFLGEVRHTAVADAVDLQRRELLIVLCLLVLVLALGLYPQMLLDVITPSVNTLLPIHP